MGHAATESVTARYIDNYPIDQQLYFNSMLLFESGFSTVDTARFQELVMSLRHASSEQIDTIFKILEKN